MDNIIHGARAVSQRRVTGQEAMRGHTVRHTCMFSKAREVCGDCLEAGYHRCSELRTSVALLENISRFLLAITENITSLLLR